MSGGNVFNFPSSSGSNNNTGSGGGNGTGGDALEKRVEKLENSINDIKIGVIKLDARLDSIEKHMASRGDLQELTANIHKSINEQTWKFVAAVTGISGLFAALAFGIARLFK